MITGSRQLIKQRLRLCQIGRVEALGEPAVDRPSALHHIQGTCITVLSFWHSKFPPTELPETSVVALSLSTWRLRLTVLEST